MRTKERETATEKKEKHLDLHNEQLNCNCTATGFALSCVFILIGISSKIRSVTSARMMSTPHTGLAQKRERDIEHN